jgi:tetratricopeptide (TPR) repeat protein
MRVPQRWFHPPSAGDDRARSEPRPQGAIWTNFSAAVLAIALFAVSVRGESKWIRLSSPSVDIFTDGSENSARAVLDRFATLHRIFRDSNIAESPPRLRVFIFASEHEFEKYRPSRSAAGFYQNDGEQDLIVLAEGIQLKNIASHEYLHRVIQHASPLLPGWLNEGLPEFYSTIAISGAKVRIGGPIERHLVLLVRERWMDAEDLALGNRADGAIFYAESWALVHMLSLSPKWHSGMPEFVKLLSEGRDQQDAFQSAFGSSMDDALRDLRLYVRKMKDVTEAGPPVETPDQYNVTHLAPLDATLALADLALRTDHPKLARSLFEKTAKENPESPAAVAGLGSLALAGNDKEGARVQFERAVAMGIRDARTYFELAALTRDNALLEKTVALDPDFAEAHFLLGVRFTDDGRFAAAIEHLEKAVALQPRRLTYWNALGYARVKSGDRRGAAEAARRAAVLAHTPEEEKMAAGLTQLAGEQPSVRQKKPDMVTPPSWQNPKGDTRVEGILTEVDCNADPVRLVVSVRNPAEVELINAQGVSTTLVCGTQSLPVALQYLAATREVTRIEFKPAVIIKR